MYDFSNTTGSEVSLKFFVFRHFILKRKVFLGFECMDYLRFIEERSEKFKRTKVELPPDVTRPGRPRE